MKKLLCSKEYSSSSLLGPRPKLIEFLSKRLSEDPFKGLKNGGIGILYPATQDIPTLCDVEDPPVFCIEYDALDDTFTWSFIPKAYLKNLMCCAEARFRSLTRLWSRNGGWYKPLPQERALGIISTYLSVRCESPEDNFQIFKFNLSVLHKEDDDRIDVRHTAVLHVENDGSVTVNEFNMKQNLRANTLSFHTFAGGTS